ncbi:DNA polymerase POL4 [Aspergillus flavus AF70]|nr:DNA polymerase POL4 [Aspergillus flavus AF70]
MSPEMVQSISDKETFFQGLERLDALLDDSGDDAEGLSQIIALSEDYVEPVHHDEPALSDSPVQKLGALGATSALQSPSLDVTVQGKCVNTSIIVVEDVQDPTVKGSKIMALKKNKVDGKKKRTSTTKIVPEQHQIFKGLVFFFFPNSDVSPLRRLRIQRAQEYGALWARTWGDNVTHVIVDKGLAFQEVLKHLCLETFPKPNIALLDESYPSECIKFRTVLSTSHVRFRINGMPVVSKAKEVSQQNEPSDESLPLKPAGRQKRQLETQSQSSESEDDSEYPPDAQRVNDFSDEAHKEVVSEPLRERDALDDIIDEAKAVNDLPLDPLDSFDDEHVTEEADLGTSEESDCQPNTRKRKRSSGRDNEGNNDWQQKFACVQKHDPKSNSENPNRRTIDVLQQMLDYYARTDDHWRTLAYRKAISALRRQPKKILTKSQALAIPGVGPRLADKIEEIVCTNRLRRLENTNLTREDIILQEFLGVYGAGISQASRWLAQGYRSLEDLRTKASLTPQQEIGVDHYHDFSQRIPRKEVETHGEIVKRVVQKADPGMQVIIAGSYRRGAADCGDIDLLITKPDATIEQIRALMIDVVVPKLFKRGFLQASLAITSRGDGSKWHGASLAPGGQIWRRIDLLFVPGSEIGAALIYFTGNDIFNRSMRLLASKKGMRLNQRGLYTDVLRGPQRVKLNTGRLLEGRDERRIFEILGVPWRPPEHRIC